MPVISLSITPLYFLCCDVTFQHPYHRSNAAPRVTAAGGKIVTDILVKPIPVSIGVCA